MYIKTNGVTPLTKVQKMLKDAIGEVISEVKIDPKTKVRIKNFECAVEFMVGGQWQVLTVNHDNLEEIFTIAAALDEKGNVITAKNNSEQSFIDDYTRSVLKGEVKEYGETTSEYADEDLELIDTVAAEDTAELTYVHKAKNVYVIRYFKGNKLVGELETKEIPNKK